MFSSNFQPNFKPNIQPNAADDQAILDARAAIVEKWPFSDNLIGVNSTPTTYTRASAEIYENVFGQYQKYTTDAAAYGVGITQHPAITNKNEIYNLNPDAGLSGLTVTAGSLTVSRVLVSSIPEPYKSQVLAKFSDLIDAGDMNGYIFKAVAVGVCALRIDGATANTNNHSSSVFAVETTGSAGANSYRVEGQATISVNIPSEFQQIKIEDWTPTASRTMQFRLEDSTVYFLGNMLTETTTAPRQLIECAGTSGNVAQTDTQLPTFADNYVDYSEDFSQWTANVGASYDPDTGELTFGADPASGLTLSVSSSALASTNYSFIIQAKQGTLTDFRLAVFDNGSGGLQLQAKTTDSNYDYYLYNFTYGDGASRTVQIRNAAAGTSGTIFIKRAILTTSPILPKYLETTGSSKIYEMGNIVLNSENVGGAGYSTGATLVVTQNYGIAPDGRQTTSLLDDPDPAVNNYCSRGGTVADDSELRYVSVFIRKTQGTPTHYPAIAAQYQGGTNTFKVAVINPTTGEVTATTADSAEVEDHGDFWRLIVGSANNSSGNTTLGCVLYAAFNTDGSITGNAAATGTNEFWGAQIIDYDVDTDQYCPTWGSARKLRYNQIWENRSWIYLKVQDYVDGAGFPAIFSSEIDDNNRITIVVNNPANSYFLRKIAGVSDNININQYPETGDDIEVLIQSEPTGEATFTININGTEYENTDPVPDDWLLGDIIQLGCRPVLTNYAIGKYSNFKWGVLPAGGITLDGARYA